MKTKVKVQYHSPRTEVVEFKMEQGILVVSNGQPEQRRSLDESWGGSDEWY